MSRPYVPRAAWYLFALNLFVLALAGLAARTHQPLGVSSLAVGFSLGLTLGVVVMIAEVCKAHRR